MVAAIPADWQWPGEPEPAPMFKSVRDPMAYKLRMLVDDMVAVHGRAKTALMLADIAEELV